MVGQKNENLLINHSLDQKINNVVREVPHSTPEVEGNNGSLHHSSAGNSNNQLESNFQKESVISSKLQILDGEKLYQLHKIYFARKICYNNTDKQSNEINFE